jgi:hypothetical protein
MELTKEQLRFLSESCRRNAMTPSQAREFIVKAWGEHAVTLRSVQRWYKEFSEGTRASFEDEHKSGRPRSSRTEKGANLLHQPAYSPDMNLCDRFVFRLIENARRDYNLRDSDDVKTFVTDVISGFTLEMLSHEFSKLCDDLKRIIESGGDYL